MNESQISLQGWVGSDVELRETTAGAVATFRLACTPRYYRNNEWHDGPTSWFTVKAWRGLARNVHESIGKGDPVFVQGRMRVEQWTPQGEDRSRTVATVEASIAGHDLNRGTSRYARPVRLSTQDARAETEVAEPSDEERPGQPAQGARESAA